MTKQMDTTARSYAMKLEEQDFKNINKIMRVLKIKSGVGAVKEALKRLAQGKCS